VLATGRYRYYRLAGPDVARSEGQLRAAGHAGPEVEAAVTLCASPGPENYISCTVLSRGVLRVGQPSIMRTADPGHRPRHRTNPDNPPGQGKHCHLTVKHEEPE
jgi:hypothetical protein